MPTKLILSIFDIARLLKQQDSQSLLLCTQNVYNKFKNPIDDINLEDDS